MSRFYVRTRRAWSPRMWPILLVGVIAIVLLSVLLSLTPLEGIGLGFLIGVGLAVGRWEVWKWMHPEITREEYITDIRRAAPWN